jgi:hypothetical protein
MMVRNPLCFLTVLALTGAAACHGARTDDPPKESTAEAQPAAPAPDPPPELTRRRVFSKQLASEQAFLDLSQEVAGERYSKFIIDLKTDDIYYFDVNVYKLHIDFVFGEIYKRPVTADAIPAFNRNYDGVKPDFLFCYLVHHLGPDLWTFAFWEGDLMTQAHVARAYARVKATFPGERKLHFRPDSTLHEKVSKKLPKHIPILTNDEIYKKTDYHAFNPGKRVGKLRIVRDTEKPETLVFAPEEIVILAESLPDITVVSGIISEQFSTPLSHVALRAAAWGIPHVGLRKAAKTYAALAGQWVFFDAKPGSHELRKATPEEVQEREAQMTAKRTVRIPSADLAQRDLRPLAKLRGADTPAYGAKSSNLGQIAAAHLPGFEVPDGFGIPIVHYGEFMKSSGLDAHLAKLLDDPKFASDPAHRKAELEALRAAILKAPLQPDFGKAVWAEASKLLAKTQSGLFVRSSTNAEDLPGFNGAGLYDTVANVMDEPGLHDAIRTVWASVWNLRAYEERQYFGIDHRQVFGACLVQVGMNATASGVLVTTNLFNRQDLTTYTINAKNGLGMRVVEGQKVPEQLLFDYSNNGIKVLSRSDEDTMLVFDAQGGLKEVPNPNKGEPVLTDTRAYRLVMASRGLVDLFAIDQALDIEWLFAGDKLWIVQARPFISPES